MKKTALTMVVILVCAGLTLPVWGAQSNTQTTKSKKPPAVQTVPEPVKPATPQTAPQAIIPPAAPQQAQPPLSQIIPHPAQPGTQPVPQAVSQPEPPDRQAVPSAVQPDVLPVPQAPEAVMPQASPAAQQPPTAPEPVQMRKEVVKVNYIEAQEAFQILMAYKSARGRIQIQRNRNILIIEDTPDFVDKLLSILKELDVRPLDLMFTVDVIMGSMEEKGGEKIPGSDKLLKELKSLLRYEHFARLDTSLIKVQDNGRTSQRMGGQGIGLLLELYPRHVSDGAQDGFQVELSLRQTTRQFSRPGEDGKPQYMGTPLEKSMSLLQTSLMLKDGERSVVGVSKLNGGDTALIMVIEGKVIR